MFFPSNNRQMLEKKYCMQLAKFVNMTCLQNHRQRHLVFTRQGKYTIYGAIQNNEVSTLFCIAPLFCSRRIFTVRDFSSLPSTQNSRTQHKPCAPSKQCSLVVQCCQVEVCQHPKHRTQKRHLLPSGTPYKQ